MLKTTVNLGVLFFASRNVSGGVSKPATSKHSKNIFSLYDGVNIFCYFRSMCQGWVRWGLLAEGTKVMAPRRTSRVGRKADGPGGRAFRFRQCECGLDAF